MNALYLVNLKYSHYNDFLSKVQDPVIQTHAYFEDADNFFFCIIFY